MEDLIVSLGPIGISLINFYNSTFFSVVKFIFGIYAVVILVDIILLLIQRGLSGDVRETLFGLDLPPELVVRKGSLRKKWNKVKEKLESDNESKWKVAIIEADNIIDSLIVKMKYSGENMTERLNSINPGQIENIEDLKNAHETRNRIIHEENFHLTKEKAEEVIGWYEKFLKEFQVLD